jgi:REP element-mobilizing transposase RayT
MISRDTPALYLTAVTHVRLPVFRTHQLCGIACAALDEARRSGTFLIFAYVLMPDHIHVITDGSQKPSHILRYVKGIVSRRIINHLKERRLTCSLEKLRHDERRRGHKYSLWQEHSNAIFLISEAALMQKVNYIHQNPVRWGLMERSLDYRWSSARCWARFEAEEEPLKVDLDRIMWRRYPR